MKLTAEERAMLAGEAGPAVRRAMEIVVTLGRIYEAEELVPVVSVQVAGVSYRNLGEAGLEFLRDWATAGARVRVPTTLNPAGMDLDRWREMGIPEDFAGKQNEVIAAYAQMGIQLTCTCTPYLVGNVPGYGEHIAWSESSAVCFANSILGARTNREGGPGALAAAIAGRTAAYGLHLETSRRATHHVDVRCPVRRAEEYAALGYLVGRAVGDGIPYFTGLELPAVDATDPRMATGEVASALDALKLLGAALASSGAVALFHIAGVTPEARREQGLEPAGLPAITVETLAPAYAALNTAQNAPIDLVVIGCPHASLAELRQVAEGLHGKRVTSDLWVTTSRAVRALGTSLGLVPAIEQAGGRVLADGCVVVAPMRALRYHTLATNSAKMACYAPSHAGLEVRFGALEECLAAAITGRWAS